MDQHDLVATQAAQAGFAISRGIVGLADRRLVDQGVQVGRHAQVERMAEHGQLDRIGCRAEQTRREHAPHQRQDAFDIAVTAADIEVAIKVAEEELGRRPFPRRGEEIGEAATQSACLPLLQRLEQWQQVARIALRVAQPGIGLEQRPEALLGGESVHGPIIARDAAAFHAPPLARRGRLDDDAGMSAAPTASPRTAVLLGLLVASLLILIGLKALGTWAESDRAAAQREAELIGHALWLRGEMHALAAAEAQWIAQGRADDLGRVDRQRSATQTALDVLDELADEPTTVSHAGQLRELVAQSQAAIEKLNAQRGMTGPRAGPVRPESSAAAVQARGDTLVSALHADAMARLAELDARAGTRSMLGWILLALALPVLALQLALLFFESRSRRRAEADQVRHQAQAERAQREAERYAGDLERLGELGDQLRPTRSIEEIGEVLRASMQHVLPQFHGALYLQAPSRNLVRRQVAWGKPATPLEDLFTPEDCWAVRRGIPYPNDPKAPPCRHLAADTDPAHVVCVPLMSQGEPLGILHLSGEVAPLARERRIAQGIADLLALSISQLRLQESLRVQSVRDPLTGLFNRRYIDASLLRECLRARRAQQTLALLLIDLDEFKHFNERHSHEAGDAALSQIGQLIGQTIRPEDVAGRHGGEEFLVLMPETDLSGALDRAELLRRALFALRIDLHGRKVEAVRCSIGVAIYPLHGSEPGLCLRAAEKAVQAAKQAGRDQVVAAPMPDAAQPAAGS